MLPSTIPQELRDSPQWVCWRYAHRPGDPKPTKEPINTRSGQLASTKNPETWASLDAVMKRFKAGRVDGIGYVFDDDHIGIDLDNAIDESGRIKAWAAEIVNACATYTEISPSGIGLHLISKGSLPPDWSGRKRAYHDGAVEIYSRGRFFTFTGNRFQDTPAECVDQTAYIIELYKMLSGGNGNGNGKSGNRYHAVKSIPVKDVDARLQVALRDMVFSRLWHGDTSGNGHDDSSADLALCNKLVFYFGPDPDAIDSLFRQSKLYRDKWERPDYRTWTINKAIGGAREFYTPSRHGHAENQPLGGNDTIRERGKEKTEEDQPTPSPTLKNAVRTITEKNLVNIWFDDFRRRPMTGDPARDWTDADDLELTITLQAIRGFDRIGLETVRHAASTIAFRNRKNCVREWLDSLQWDGEPRIHAFFEDHFGAAATAYTRAASKNFWIAMIARVYRPGCQVDHVVVLEGSQGTGKSSALRIIGGEWFCEQHESATNAKAFAEIIQGNLLVEISEMDSFNRTEVTRVKQTITNRDDRYREAYGHRAERHPRQCVFVGTTNRSDWHKDETGGRRFWPIACNGEIDLGAIRANREQLFAEAVHRFKAGETWWEMPAEETRAEQDKRYDEDAWMEMIQTYVLTKEKTTVLEVMTDCLKFEPAKMPKADQMRVATCLRRLGWERGKNERVGTGQVRFWRENPAEGSNKQAATTAATCVATQ
jgi:predicted P-loop ATPase